MRIMTMTTPMLVTAMAVVVIAMRMVLAAIHTAPETKSES